MKDPTSNLIGCIQNGILQVFLRGCLKNLSAKCQPFFCRQSSSFRMPTDPPPNPPTQNPQGWLEPEGGGDSEEFPDPPRPQDTGWQLLDKNAGWLNPCRGRVSSGSCFPGRGNLTEGGVRVTRQKFMRIFFGPTWLSAKNFLAMCPSPHALLGEEVGFGADPCFPPPGVNFHWFLTS